MRSEIYDKDMVMNLLNCLLLQVVDLTNLHPGIDQYYRGHVRPDSASAKHSRLKPLNLLHYTGNTGDMGDTAQLCAN